MPALMQKIGKMLLDGVNAGNIEDAYKKLGAAGETVVLQAFATGGPGWEDLKSGKPARLVNTGQLRASISYRVVTR